MLAWLSRRRDGSGDLAAAARQRGAQVNLEFAWNRPHSGDYDPEALFAWIQAQVS